MRVLGIDPGFSYTGVALADVEDKEIEILDTTLIETKSKTTKGLQSFSDATRCQELHKSLQPWLKVCDMVCIEVPGGSKSLKAAKHLSYALAVCCSHDLELCKVTPLNVKLRTAGRGASKDDMATWVEEHYPYIELPKAKYKREHIADAISIISAALKIRLD